MSEEAVISKETEEPKVIGSLTIAIVEGSPAKIQVNNDGMNPYMIPTLLRQLAQNFEDSILETRSLIE